MNDGHGSDERIGVIIIIKFNTKCLLACSLASSLIGRGVRADGNGIMRCNNVIRDMRSGHEPTRVTADY